jgi:lysozyme
MNDNLKLSPAGANLIKAFESCLRPIGGGRFTAYRDPVGVLTIGWGHTNHHGRQFKYGDVWTQAECDAEFLKDMARFEAAVKRLVKVPLRQSTFDALVSFSFNVGEGNLGKSTLLKRVNAGKFEEAADEFLRWNKAGGRVLKGLTRRRRSERLLFKNIPDRNYDGSPDREIAAASMVSLVAESPSETPAQYVDNPEPESGKKVGVIAGVLGAIGGVMYDWRVAVVIVVALALAVGIAWLFAGDKIKLAVNRALDSFIE